VDMAEFVANAFKIFAKKLNSVSSAEI